MAARTRKGTKDNPWAESTRLKIQASNVVNELIKHVLNKRKMTNTQVAAALGLLKKILPDLQKTELTNGDGKPLDIVLNITQSPKG